MKTLSAFALLIAGLAVGTSPAAAQNAPSSTQAEKKDAAKKPVAKKKARAEDDVPDAKGLQATQFNCELGNKLTIYTNAADDGQIALQWKKRMHRMHRVSTSTGAHRFENAKSGLVWIGIPAKGMLLDSKKGRQLANECRNAEQAAQKATEG